MTRSNHIRNAFGLAFVALLALAMGACETDSPTAPAPTPAPVPGGGAPPSTTWLVQVTITPDRVEVPPQDSEEAATFPVSAIVRVTVRRADNGAPPPNNATVVLAASAGTLTTPTGATGTAVPLVLTNGVGQATLALVGPPPGTVVVQAQIEGSIGQGVLRIIEGDPDPEDLPLFIESISPTSGPPSGGTLVTIRGTGFATPLRVFFGGIPGVVESSTDSEIRVRTPAIDLEVGEIQTVAVTVDVNVNEEDQASDTLANAFTYAREGGNPSVPPRIISVTPTFGPNEGGTEVTILGEGFGDQVQVFFGDEALIEATVLQLSDDRILVRTPSALGPNAVNRDSIVSVRVVNRDTGQSAVLANAFQYGSPSENVIITSVSPNQAPFTGGTLVEVIGQGFDEPVAVTFADIGQIVQSVTGTKIVVRTVAVEIENCADVVGPVRVVNTETGVGATGPDFRFRVVSPVIFGISPTSSSAAGGGEIVITGSGFIPPVRVVFQTEDGPVAAPNAVVEAGGTIIRATIPPFNGSFDTEPCGDGGERFVPTTVDVEVLALETGCEDVFENSFTYIPEDTTCRLPPPEASFAVSVSGDTVFVTDTSTGTTASTTYTWNFGDGTIINNGDPNESHTYAQPGTYTIILTVTTEFGSDTASQEVTIEAPEPPPTANFSFVVNGLMVDFTDTSSGNPTMWVWDFGDGGNSAQQDPSHTYAVAGTYDVMLTASNATGSDSIVRQVTVP